MTVIHSRDRFYSSRVHNFGQGNCLRDRTPFPSFNPANGSFTTVMAVTTVTKRSPLTYNNRFPRNSGTVSQLGALAFDSTLSNTNRWTTVVRTTQPFNAYSRLPNNSDRTWGMSDDCDLGSRDFHLNWREQYCLVGVRYCSLYSFMDSVTLNQRLFRFCWACS